MLTETHIMSKSQIILRIFCTEIKMNGLRWVWSSLKISLWNWGLPKITLWLQTNHESVQTTEIIMSESNTGCQLSRFVYPKLKIEKNGLPRSRHFQWKRWRTGSWCWHGPWLERLNRKIKRLIHHSKRSRFQRQCRLFWIRVSASDSRISIC